MSPYNTLVVERPRPGIVLARLNRPDRLNAITFEMFSEFVLLQREVDSDPEARVLIVTGSGRADSQRASTWTRRPPCPTCPRR